MPPLPLPGAPGLRIKKRIESAVFRFKQVINWEDLRIYILQDPKWDWDDDIVLDWQRDITAHFLECCRDYHSDAMIQAFAAALEDGQQFQALGDTNVNEAADLADSDHSNLTITQENRNEARTAPKFDRIIFFVRWGNKDYDGLTVKHTDEPMSRISSKIVLERWNLETETYLTLVAAMGRMMSVIDLTWELQMKESVKKSYTTTFVLFPDDTMKSDAEFGQNKFEPPCSIRQKKGHSTTKSLSNVEMSGEEKASKSRSQAGKSSSGSSHRRQTVPSTSGRSEDPRKEEYKLNRVVAGLLSLAELEWREQEQYLETDADDDESYASSKGKQQSSPNTSVDSKDRVHVRRGGR